MILAQPEETREVALSRPLLVQLSGTLVKSDIFLDSLLTLVRRQPRVIAQLPRWLGRGKHSFRARIEIAACLNVAYLPYDQKLVSYLRQQRDLGRKLYLSTDGDGLLAQRVMEHLNIFEGKVFAHDGSADFLQEMRNRDIAAVRCAPQFDFIGSSMRQHRHRLDDAPSLFVSVRRAIRLHQWAKNLLLFLPLLLAHTLSVTAVSHTALAFLCFGFCASASYLVNDLLDLDADRHHPRKRLRPFAAGDLSVRTGFGMVIALLSLGVAGAWALSPGFLGWLLAYLVVTFAYSFSLKKFVLVDVLVLSGLYTVRLLAGAAVTGTQISPWLSGFSLFLFLSLAMVKRFSELHNLLASGQVPKNGRGYLLLDIEPLRSFGTSSGYASVVIFALYISGHDIMALYSHPHRMWLICPILIWWISRFWLLASRGELDEDPVVFALTDRTSSLIGACIVVIAICSL